MTWSDVAIIVFYRRFLAPLEDALLARGVPFHVRGGRGFFQTPEVSDVVALLGALTDPRDDVALVALLRSPFFSFSDPLLWRISRMEGRSFEEKLDRFPGNLPRASVELAKDWRSDRVLRRLEALLAVADARHSYLLSGSGEVIEPDDGIVAIGSGGPMALAAARALWHNSDLTAPDIVERSLEIAGEICIYSNTDIVVLELESGNR